MAIVEARAGVFPRIADRAPSPVRKLDISPTTQFTSEDVLSLAKIYSKNWEETKAIGDNDMNEVQAWVLGTMEIQRVVLKMLGQNRLLSQKHFMTGELGFDPILKLIEEPRTVTGGNIQALGEMYIKSSKLFIDGDIDKKRWTKEGLSPAEERIRGNVEELSRILNEFGQEKLVKQIDTAYAPFNQINWTSMRSTGHGELY